ncbi:MAG: hypothetical protein AB7V55_05265 [Oscillospiraceae bacterium]|jgi:hypothetical protein
MERKSNGFLKVTGILMIISGAISIIFSIIALLGVGVLAAALGGDASLTLLILASVLALVSSVISLVAGVLGVKNAARPEKATVCIVFGILTAVFSVLGNVLTVAGGGSFSIPSLILGLVIPVLYLIGAFQNKKLA